MAESTHLARYSRRQQVDQFLNLLMALVRRDITARYRRSLLGPLWAILQPLILMVLFSLLRSIVDIPSDGVPYVIFSYAGLVPWTFFTNAVSFCGPSVALNANVIKKSAVAREVFPASAVVTALFDLLMSSLVLFGMMVWFHVPFTWALLWLPVLIALLTLLSWGVGLIIASLATYKRDFIFATPFLMQFWMYATPVIYPLSSVPDHLHNLYILNPAVGLIEGFRAVLVHGQSPDLSLLAISAVSTVVVCAITWPIFRYMSQYFADVL